MIDPESIATFATASSALTSVLGLIGQFKSGRDAASGASYNDFMVWLTKSNHHELKSLIEANQLTALGIKAALGQHVSQVNDALTRIDAAVAAFASTIEGFSALSAALNPQASLSAQAFEILRLYEKSGASKAQEMKLRGHTVLHPLDGQGGSFKLSDPRFLHDDIETLLGVRLLTLSLGQKGERIFHYTRSAHDLVKTRR